MAYKRHRFRSNNIAIIPDGVYPGIHYGILIIIAIGDVSVRFVSDQCTAKSLPCQVTFTAGNARIDYI